MRADTLWSQLTRKALPRTKERMWLIQGSKLSRDKYHVSQKAQSTNCRIAYDESTLR